MYSVKFSLNAPLALIKGTIYERCETTLFKKKLAYGNIKPAPVLEP